MKNIGKLAGGLVIFVVCISSLANAQAPDFSGTWTGKTVCPIGSVEFTMEIQGENGAFTYDGYGPQKLYATKFPVKVTQREMYVHFAGPNQGADFGSFQGTLLADGTVGNVYGLKVNGGYCEEFPLSRGKAGDQSRVSKGAPSFNAKGLTNEPFLTKLMQGSFATINVPTDHAVFNSLYGSYLGSYARKCAADPKTRPKNFVEMTNLECVEEGITATYYRNGMYTESAPYCTRWKDVPSGLYADPKMWEVKKKLDAVLLGDTYKSVFAFMKKLDKPDIFEGVFEASPQMIVAAIATGARDMDALVEMNACNSLGLMRFQENLRLYAINRPFGIRLDGSSGAPIPIPAPGTTFKDPNYETLLEDMVKDEARSWPINKYLLKSIANPSVISRDSQGRPLSVTAGYKFGGMGGMTTGSVTLTFFEGYPECLYFFDKPNACRSPNKEVTARYVHGGYSLQNAHLPTPEEKHLAANHSLSKLTKEQKQERDQIEKQASKKEKCKSFEESLALELKSQDPDKIKRQAWTKQFYAALAKKEGCVETVSSVGNSSTLQNPKARAFCKSYPKRIADARAGVGIRAGGGHRERMIQSLEDKYAKYQCDAIPDEKTVANSEARVSTEVSEVTAATKKPEPIETKAHAPALDSVGLSKGIPCTPIQFKKGTSSITLNGQAPAEDVQCLKFRTNRGQTVELSIGSGNGNVAFSISKLVDNRDHYQFISEKKTYEILIHQTLRAIAPEPYTLTLSIN